MPDQMQEENSSFTSSFEAEVTERLVRTFIVNRKKEDQELL